VNNNYKRPLPAPVFPFQKYVNPIWYFNLIPFEGEVVPTAHYSGIPANLESSISADHRYLTSLGAAHDRGIVAWNKGVLCLTKPDKLRSEKTDIPISLEDNYTYIRKYQRRPWAWYVLLRRLFSLRNPFKEISAFFKTRNIQRSKDIFTPLNSDEGYHTFSSGLIRNEPLVSIIIPTLTRYVYLKDVLRDLSRQDYQKIEIIVVDQTDTPDKQFYSDFKLPLRVIFQEGKGQWLARNEAIRQAKGDYLLFFDDDSRVEADWVTQHLKAIDYFKADISAGVSISKVGDKVPLNYSYFRWADQFDSGNAMVERGVFEKIGMFDRQFDKMRMGDGEFGLRAYLHGFKSISNPYAKRLHLKVDSGGLRELGNWDGFKPKKLFAPNPIPSVLYYYRKYYPPSYVRNGLVIGVLGSLLPYYLKDKKALYPVAFILAILGFPLVIGRLIASWRLSGRMLKIGDKIERL
jgi:glycosyltransferase involved in cell wall biosynthesis